MRSEILTGPEGVLVTPENHCGTGVLTLAGSSGRVDDERAHLFAAHGALALSIRWFGGPGQPTGPRLVPLETFTEALDRLAGECDRLIIAGMSFGAEAALLVAAADTRIDGCIAMAPSCVTWSFIDPDGSQVSHWSSHGTPVPAVPLDTTWRADTDPPAYLECYRRSLQVAAAETVSRATIPVERIADLLLVAGGDDQVWPSVDFAARIVARRREHGLATDLVTMPAAGHRTTLPGEDPVTVGAPMRRGGSEATNAALGRLAWPRVRRMLRVPD